MRRIYQAFSRLLTALAQTPTLSSEATTLFDQGLLFCASTYAAPTLDKHMPAPYADEES